MFLSHPPIATKPSKPSRRNHCLDRVSNDLTGHERITHARGAHGDTVRHRDGVEEHGFGARFIGAGRGFASQFVDVHIARA